MSGDRPRDLAKESCDYCKQPVYCDEGIHGISHNHYRCEAGVKEKFEEDSKKIDAIFAELGIKPKRKREGTGKTAQKALKVAIDAIEAMSGGKVLNPLVWNQRGAYRGQRWDLAAWGVDFDLQFKEGEEICKGSFACWASMTAVSKMEKLAIVEEGIPYTYEA